MKETLLQKELTKSGYLHKTLDELIIDCISKKPIKDQDEIIAYLKQYNMNYTQSSLSRKMVKLGIKKVNGAYKQVQKSFGASSHYGPLLIQSVTTSPPNLIILKTLPGHGQALAYQLEHKISNQFIAGVIAGDDTVFLASNGEKPLGELVVLIEKSNFK